MDKKKKEIVADETLSSIRESLSQVDAARLRKDITEEQRELLELSAVALKEVERRCIAKLEGKILDSLSDSIEPLRQKGKEIRSRVTRMGKVPKTLDGIEDVVEMVVGVMKGVVRWK